MTTRIYYDDAAVTTFEAEVLSCRAVEDGRFEVTLTRTAFYPTSGGQPFDTGQLAGVPVVDVVDRDDDVVHVVGGAMAAGTTVIGEVEPVRRRDHREQHTGQHVLSAVFDRVCGVATVGFHMGAEVSTIDLSREMTAAEIAEAERQANDVVRQDRPVRVRTVPAEQVAGLGLRRSPTRSGPLRIVEIEGVDLSACGGTHVARTGEVGLIMVVKTEKVRAGTRLSFVCGGRAMREAQSGRDVLAELGRLLGVAPGDVVASVERLLESGRGAARALTDLRAELAGLRAAQWRAGAETIGPHRVVLRDHDAEGGDLKALAQAIVVEPGMVAALIGRGSPIPVVIARSSDVVLDAGAVMKRLTSTFGGRGGGRPELAQGAVAASVADLRIFLRGELAGSEAVGPAGA